MDIITNSNKKDLSWVAYVGTYPPRECGIAEFTQDLTVNMDKRFNPSLRSKVIAINDNGSSTYNYDKNKVKAYIDESDVEAYIDIAKYINNSKKIQLVSIQHEFGIFGGNYGEYIIPFLETLTKPVVTTFHSVLPMPDERRKKVVQAIIKRSSAAVVMTKAAVDILANDYGINARKIRVIPHGVPNVAFRNSMLAKKSLGLQDKTVISTFGLLSSGKGIEYVINALPKIIEKHPDILYLVIGETHPQVRKHEGERYRNKLRKLVEKLGLKDNVKFYNKYIPTMEIMKYLSATDVYVFAGQDPNQITSGTLAYAVGAGKAIVSTPCVYSRDTLADGRGIFVNFDDSESISQAVNGLLDNDSMRKELESKTYEYSRMMTWQNVAASYLGVFREVVELKEGLGMHKFPKIKLNHLRNLTDDTGIIQHAKHSVTDRNTGYTLDDNARALIVACNLHARNKDEASLGLMNTYLSFIRYTQREDGRFHNIISYDRRILDEIGSEDSYGRAILAAAHVVASNSQDGISAVAKFVFDNAIKHVYELEHLRPKAFSIIGLCKYYEKHKHEDILEKIKKLANDIVGRYEEEKSDEWRWFENSVTYSNGSLPEALFYAYQATKDEKYLKVAEESLAFLSSLVMMKDSMTLIGHNGWYNQHGKRAMYDQQPVDAASMVEVFSTAYEVTRNKEYYDKAVLAFNWFLGKNSLGMMVYDETTGGSYDGLLSNCVNLNQGAESTVCYLIARLRLEEIRK